MTSDMREFHSSIKLGLKIEVGTIELKKLRLREGSDPIHLNPNPNLSESGQRVHSVQIPIALLDMVQLALSLRAGESRWVEVTR